MKIFFAWLFSFLIANSASATVSFYYAVGPLFSNPGSVRVGSQTWEGGLLAPTAIGIDKIFKISEVSYMAFGPVITLGGLGLYGSIGRKGKLFWLLHYRAELQSTFSFSGHAQGSGLLGITLDF